MQLVVRTTSSDGGIQTFTHIRPVEYESPEAFLVNVEDAARAAWPAWSFEFAGHEWDRGEMGYMDDNKDTDGYGDWIWFFDGIEVMTVDEWFAKYGGR
jgi:hypothetical protein